MKPINAKFAELLRGQKEIREQKATWVLCPYCGSTSRYLLVPDSATYQTLTCGCCGMKIRVKL